MAVSVLESKARPYILLTSVFIISVCALVYELLISTASSYFLGDSVKQFSLTIGFFMAGMGVGSFLSRLVKTNVLQSFIHIEIALGIFGGLSIPLLYLTVALSGNFFLVMISSILIIGILIGFEIPLLTRILSENFPLRFNLSNVLSLDYLGALFASLVFPFFLLPTLGTFRTSLFFGIINIITGAFTFYFFREELKSFKKAVFIAYTLLFGLIISLILIYSDSLLKIWNDKVFNHPVVYSEQTKYQSIVLTAQNKIFNLYLNGHLQFSSLDEYRYHESLTVLPMTLLATDQKKQVLILGGGDGLVARELLKFDHVENITLVDIDPKITKLAKNHGILLELNKGSLNHQKVTIHHQDAFNFIRNNKKAYDLIIADLPDPSTVSLAKLYSRQFYRMINNQLAPGGIFVTQASNSMAAKKAFWCIKKTLEEAGFKFTYPYHLHIPSFGEWGFIMAAQHHFSPHIDKIPVNTRFLTPKIVNNLFNFPKDMLVQNSALSSSSLDNPQVMTYYLDGWAQWN